MMLDEEVTEKHGVIAGLLMPDWRFFVVNYHDGDYSMRHQWSSARGFCL